jgi:hypothetical protein
LILDLSRATVLWNFYSVFVEMFVSSCPGKVEWSLAGATEESSMSYLKNVGAVLSACRLVDLDAPTVRLVMERIAAFDHIVVG